MISSASFAEFASVVEIVDGDTLVVVLHDWDINQETSTIETTPRHERITVRLDCIDAPPISDPIGKQAAQALQDRLLGKEVSVVYSTDAFEDTLPFVEIRLAGGHPHSEGAAQLEGGLARMPEFGPCSVNWWTKCHYELARDRARDQGLGVWLNK